MDEDTIALEVCDENTGASFFYIPACAFVPDWLKEKLKDANLLFFDGTLWKDDEMIVQNVGIKTGKRMGHISMSGEEGSLNIFKDVQIKRKVFIHINTTNPALINNSNERKIIEQAGWEVAYDTMEISI